MVFRAQAIVAPPEFLIRKEITVASDEPTLKVPGLVTVKTPLEKTQLSAVLPFKISISAVVEPKVTALTVIFASAVKSDVAAKTGTTTNKANTVDTRNFFIEIY